ncbi:MAG: non-ribosomal peptide synthetase, partial [Blastocatellia bacterium]
DLVPWNSDSDGAAGFESETVQLSPELTKQLEQFARTLQVTLSTLVEGGWVLLLARYKRARDIVYGLTVSGRPAEIDGVESIVGLFINTLPLRVQVDENFVEPWLQELQMRRMEVRQYEYTPLAYVRRWAEMDGGQSLFDTTVAFENFPVKSALQQTASSERLGFGSGNNLIEMSDLRWRERTNYPLTVNIAPESRLAIRISFDAKRFDRVTIQRMLGHYERILDWLIAQRGKRVTEAEMLSEWERHEMLMEWNDSRWEVGGERWVKELIEEEVERSEEGVAVVYGEEHVSYGELNGRANQLGNYLRGLGVGGEVVVGIVMKRSVEMVEGLLGIMKAGGAYVPVERRSPIGRRAKMLREAGVSVIVTKEENKGEVPADCGYVVSVDGDREEIGREGRGNMEVEIRGENLAYVMYTSGSTGEPKGVMVTQRGLGNYVRWSREAYGVRGGNGAPVHSEISFDLTVTSIYVPLVSGVRVELIEEGEGVEGLINCIRRGEGYSVVKVTPGHMEMMRMEEKREEVEGWSRALVIGGEELGWEKLGYWRENAGQTRIINEYGPTETVVGCSVYEVRGEEGGEGSVPIGRAIGNMKMYVVGEEGELAGIGVKGEIRIGGVGVARGYQGDGKRTAEKFVPDEYSGERGGRLYRSGDIGRWGRDGEIEYIGRGDGQVKVRGYRIEKGEVESQLRRHGGVAEAVVEVREGARGEKRLVGYVVKRRGEERLGEEELRGYLSERVPEYMVPGAYVFLDKLPLTPNGKLDRHALSDLSISRPRLAAAFTPPVSDLERKISEIWQEVLAVQRVGVDDNFFDLGGHSLLLIATVRKLAEDVGSTVSVIDVFKYPTIRSLAAFLSQNEAVRETIPSPTQDGLADRVRAAKARQGRRLLKIKSSLD